MQPISHQPCHLRLSLRNAPERPQNARCELLMGISKRGDRHLRTLLIHGARSVVRVAQRKTDPFSQWINRLPVTTWHEPRHRRRGQQERPDHLGDAEQK